MTVFFQILLVALLLAAMVMILLGISQLSHDDGFEEKSETEMLNNEMDSIDDVISRHNMFHKLLENEKRNKTLLSKIESVEEEAHKQKPHKP